MKTCRTDAHIIAPPPAVFDLLADPRRWPEAMTAIEKTEVVSPADAPPGPLGAGAIFEETRTIFGKSATERMTVRRCEPPRVIEFTAESHGSRYLTTTEVEPDGEGSRVTLTFGAEPVTLAAKLMSPLAGAMLEACRKAMEKDLAQAKAFLEAGTPEDA